MAMSVTIGRLVSFGGAMIRSPVTVHVMKGITFGGILLSALPKVDCAEEKDKPNFEKKTARKNPAEERPVFDFDTISEFVSEQLSEKGSLKGVKDLFESGVPGQVSIDINFE
jgi:hypothetical protein